MRGSLALRVVIFFRQVCVGITSSVLDLEKIITILAREMLINTGFYFFMIKLLTWMILII